jgi:hypothetical protein
MQLVVLYEEPFWIGLVLVQRGLETHIYRHVFGSEPSDPETAEFVRARLRSLLLGRPAGVLPEVERVHAGETHAARRRFVRDALGTSGLAPAVRDALEAGHRLSKSDARRDARRDREEEAEHRRELARARARERHRGR